MNFNKAKDSVRIASNMLEEEIDPEISQLIDFVAGLRRQN